MWTIGEAAGTAAALSIKQNVVPRELDVKILQKQLFSQGALVESAKISELEKVKLPSGKTNREFYEEQLADAKKYWQGKGEID